ncbi:MAG: hypothetical protein ACLQJ0_28620 [Steroidobacteraceae bacterium]|jgi:hypothetical protein
MTRTIRTAFLVAVVGLALGGTSQSGNNSVDWASIRTYVGHYHAIQIPAPGFRKEISAAQSKILFDRSFGLPGAMQYIFIGTSVASGRSSGPVPTGPCAFMSGDPNRSGENKALRIQLYLDLKHHNYGFQGEPIAVQYMVGGYSPDCGGSGRIMTAQLIGQISLITVDLPTDTDVLCGKETIQTPKGEVTETIDWYFYPDDGEPRQAPVCPEVEKVT